MTKQSKFGRQQSRQRGFSLIEVLIALIIMSVGMLGIASLYVQSMQAGRTSLFRHHAVMLAGDVADRIRANRTAGAVYTTPDGADMGCIDGGVNCNAPAMAMHDILIWETQARDTLPNGDVVVLFDNAVNPPEYTIRVTWAEAGVAQQYEFVTPVSAN